MKRTIATLMLIPALVTAKELPLIVGTIPNRDNAKITFTTFKGDCTGNDRTVYTQKSGGKVVASGCYRVVGEEMFVIWADGEIYTYPFDAITLSPEMDKLLREPE
jgi:hypothetical protein